MARSLTFWHLSVFIGLAKSNSSRAKEVAFALAQNWVRTNFALYKKYQAMFEKVSHWGSPPARPQPLELVQWSSCTYPPPAPCTAGGGHLTVPRAYMETGLLS